MVGGLQGTLRRRLVAQCGRERLDVHPSQPVDADRDAGPSAAACSTAECSTALCTSVDARRSPAQGAEDGGVQRLGGVRGEVDLVGTGAEARGHGLARGVEQQPGATTGGVQSGRVGPAVVERGEQRLAAHGVQRRARRGVQKRPLGEVP